MSTTTDDDDDEVALAMHECVERIAANSIDVSMLAAMERLRNELEEAGGRGEIWACNADTHARYFGGATEVMGLPMCVRDWVPNLKVVISSAADLDHLTDNLDEIDRLVEESNGR
jgi:hypothetical protein